MPLTLSIIDAGDMSVASQLEPKIFSCEGGTIGRSHGDDWVLPDPQRYVSSRHAVIEYDNGDYYLLDTSTNGVFLNDDEAAVGRDRSVKLSSNDRIYIGEYEILVTLEADILEQNANHIQTDAADMGSIPHDLDPLDLFGGDTSSPQSLSRAESVNSLGADVMNHTPSLDEHFIPPGIETEKQVPDDWALTQMPAKSISPSDEQALSDSKEEVRRPSTSQIPTDWDQTSIVTPPPTTPVRKKVAVHQKRVNKNSARETPPAPAERPRPGGMAASKKRQAPQASQATAQKKPVPSKEYEKLLQTMGVDRETIPPELANVLPEIIGLMVRECVSGLIEVLMARTSMKSAFRVDQTMIRPVENNPLKFSVGVDEAIENMLLKNGRGYLPALDAVREGFNDIKAHQMATMAGMQGALQDVLRRFDPEILEQRFTVGPKGNILLSVYNKTKYWDRYKELYEDIAKEAMDNFQNLLGEGFMRAYEDQMRRMESADHNPKKRDS